MMGRLQRWRKRRGRGVRHTWIMVARGEDLNAATLLFMAAARGPAFLCKKGSLLWNFSIADDALILDIGD